MPLRSILGLNWGGESSLCGGESSLGGAKALPFRSLVGVLVPLGCLLGPRWPQDPSKTPPGTDFIRFYVPTWWIFGPNLMDFG